MSIDLALEIAQHNAVVARSPEAGEFGRIADLLNAEIDDRSDCVAWQFYQDGKWWNGDVYAHHVLRRIAEYPKSRADELSADHMRAMARDALSAHKSDPCKSCEMQQCCDAGSCQHPSARQQARAGGAIVSEYKLREAKLVEAVTKAILFQDSGSTEDWEANDDLGQAAIAAYHEALAQTADARLTHCRWSAHEDVYMPNTFDGSCGVHWSFIDGDPIGNGMRFCPCCGGRVLLAAHIAAHEAKRGGAA